MSWLRFAFDFSGRLNRLQLLWCVLLLSLLASLLTAPFLLRLPPAPGGGVMITREYEVARGVVGLAIAIPSLSLFVRRAHDINRSGKIVVGLLAYLFVINACAWRWPEFESSVLSTLLRLPAAFALLALYVVPGEGSANKFGAPPPGGWFAKVI